MHWTLRVGWIGVYKLTRSKVMPFAIRIAGRVKQPRSLSTGRHVALLILVVPLCGCFRIGPQRLDNDQIGFSRALGSADKRQTLLNVVRLRYADTPSFLQTTQIISGYQLQSNVNGGFEAFPATNPSTYVSGGGSLQLQQSPTFTFQPITGEQFANTFMRPFPPSELLPFLLSGLPIDVLFRLSVQSVNLLANTTSFTRTTDAGSPGFFLLLHDLRLLQIAGLVSVRLEHDSHLADKDSAKTNGRVFLLMSPTNDPVLSRAANEARLLLGLMPYAHEAEVIYGRIPARRGQIAMLTRSMLSMMNQIGSQINVPPDDVARGRTMPTVADVGIEHRPVVVVHSGGVAPNDAYTAVQYHQTWFWISDEDFDSKLAFTVVQILLALATTSVTPGTVITIPTG